MPGALFILTTSAKADLAAIARYTAKKWGKKQALKYAGLLDDCFAKIAAQKDRSKPALPDNNSLRVCRCEHHYVFYSREKRSKEPVILAILHEHMDLMCRLKTRLPE